MAPAEGKPWCKLCNRSFPSYNSLGGHMNLHSTRRKKKKKKPRPMSPRESPITGASGRYGFRERQQRQVAVCLSDSTSSDDEPWTLAPKTECQLCFRVFHSFHGLSMHMKAHAHHHGRKMVMLEHKASRKLCAWSSADGDNDFTAVCYAPAKKPRSRRIRMDMFPAPVMMTHGAEAVDAARVLLMLSEDADKYSASNNDLEVNGVLEYSLQKTEIGLSCYRPGVLEGSELMKQEISSSDDEETKFGSLSDVLKATATHDCRLCGKVFATGFALGGHMSSHSASAHENAATFHKTAVHPKRKQLEVDNELHELNLPALGNWDCSSTRTESELNPWLVAGSLQSERMMGVV
uniref:C2H2-type domain-containing protein n=2 Tax=Oryza brachyantha TaxID=4533 RepID=J3LQP8_ORYBR